MTNKKLETKVAALETRVIELESLLKSLLDDLDTFGFREKVKDAREESKRFLLSAFAPANISPTNAENAGKKPTPSLILWLAGREEEIRKLDTDRVAEMDQIKFPISLEEALRLWLPKKKTTADQMAVYRTYLRENLPINGDFEKPYRERYNIDSHEPPLETAREEVVEKFLKLERSGKCFTPRNWLYFTHRFDRWYFGFCWRNASQRGKKGSDVRHGKNNVGKIVDEC